MHSLSIYDRFCLPLAGALKSPIDAVHVHRLYLAP